MPTVRGTHTKFSAQFRLFTMPTATAEQFLTTKIFTIFHYRTITRLMQTVLYACVKLNI